MIKTVIFDMDGLIINSERITFEGYEIECKKMGYNITKDFYITLLGNPKKIIYQKLKAEYGEEMPAEEMMKSVHAYMDKRFETEGIPLKAGILELLSYLKAHGIKAVLATSSERKRADHILKLANIEKYFSATICGDEVTKGKPDPEIFLKACDKVKGTKEESIVLEDSESGIIAAKEAGIPCICVPDMKYPEKAIAEKALMVVESLYNVKDYISNYNKVVK